MADNLKGKLHGVPLNTGVLKQLKYREELLKKTEKNVDELMLGNNRGAWVTLTSGVSILSDLQQEKQEYIQRLKSKGSPDDYRYAEWHALAAEMEAEIQKDVAGYGNEFARANVLSGGVLYGSLGDTEDPNKKTLNYQRRTGIHFNAPYSPYGVQTSYEDSEILGLRPMPGIVDFKLVSQSTFGTLRKATIQIKAHSPEQLSMLEQLYFRPGFTMLLEWGNTSYIDKDGDLSNGRYSASKKFVLGKYVETEVNDGTEEDPEMVTKAPMQMLKRDIKEHREESGGNYDGMVGKVVNFSWSLDKDLSYTANLTVLSEGETIDAVKTTFVAPKEVVDATNSSANEDYLVSVLDFLRRPDKEDGQTVQEFCDEKFGKDEVYRLASTFTVKQSGESTKTRRKRRSYISLCEFLKIFNKIILEEQDTGNVAVKFDTKFDQVMSTFPGHITNDPAIAIMPFRAGKPFSTSFPNAEESNLYGFAQDKFGTAFHKPVISPENRDRIRRKSVGELVTPGNKAAPWATTAAAKHTLPRLLKISGEDSAEESPLKIMISISHLIRIQKSFVENRNKDLEIKAVVSQFFSRLLSDLNATLGGINRLALYFNDDQSSWHIVDQNNFDLGTQNLDAGTTAMPPKLNIVGLKTEVSSLKIESKISNEMFNMMSSAAAAGGYSTDESIEGFLQYNKNLRDRYSPYAPTAPETNVPSIRDNYFASCTEETFKSLSKPWHNLVVNGIYSKEDYEDNKELHRKYMVAMFAMKEQKLREEQVPRPFGGALPISLSLTMRGVAGMKVGEAFTINEEILPSRNRGRIAFTIVGIDHSINLDNNWVTSLNTLMYNLPGVADPIPEEDNYEGDKVEEGDPAEPVPTKDTPNANRLRAALADLGYLEKQIPEYSVGELTSAIDREKLKDGSPGPDISSDMADAAISLFNTLKSELPSLSINTTGGNDHYHHSDALDYTSRHVMGNAIDFKFTPYTVKNYHKVRDILYGYALGTDGEVKFKDEYARLSGAATGAHMHVVFGKGGRDGASELRVARRRLKDNPEFKTFTV